MGSIFAETSAATGNPAADARVDPRVECRVHPRVHPRVHQGRRMPWPLAAATIGTLSLSAWAAVGYAVYWVL